MSLRAATMLLALGAAGCATVPTSTLDAFAQRSASNSFETFDRAIDPPSTLVLPVAHDVQTEGPSCGAHALASVIAYWLGPGAASGQAIYRDAPPADPSGYSIAELIELAGARGVTASGVRLAEADIVRELERGRPVLIPVRIPAIYLQRWSLPGANEPVIGLPAQIVAARVGWLSERTGMTMISHYLLVVGYEDDTFVVLEPVMGFRTIAARRLDRYRRAYSNAAIVFSGAGPPAGQAAAARAADG